MSKQYALKAAIREQAGKGAARSLRRAGEIPAVIYGDKKEPVKITLNQNEVDVEYNRGHMYTTLCNMDLNGEKHMILARDVQLHPVTDVVVHVDFLRVTEKTKIVVAVPVTMINEDKSPGMQEKGVLNITRFEVEVLCQAKNIPETIEVSLEGKDYGDAIKASDAILPEGAKFVIDDRDFTIATLSAPKTAEQLEAELELDEEDGIEPEEEEIAEGEEEAEEGEEKAEGEEEEGKKESEKPEDDKE